MPLRPATADELAEIVTTAAGTGQQLLIQGGGSKAACGRPVPDAAVLDMRSFAGIIDYDPAELVLTVGSATPLAEIRALVAGRDQMLAFDPFDYGPLFGEPAGRATIGGTVAAGIAGSQRVSHGSARDHLLGFEAVSGRGERFVAGAKVVKNVTGYDLPKLAAGSWGQLFAMTQLTLKVLPAPRSKLTKIIEGLDFPAAQLAMAAALGSQAEVAAAAYRPARAGQPSRTAIRIQGFAPSVAARSEMLNGMFGNIVTADAAASDAFWESLRTLAPLDPALPLWRINVAPSRARAVVTALITHDTQWLADWGGGLLWLASAVDPAAVRSAAATAGGHAQLVRAPAALRVTTPMFQPQQPGVAALEMRIRRAFDPAGVFETGRFL